MISPLASLIREAPEFKHELGPSRYLPPRPVATWDAYFGSQREVDLGRGSIRDTLHLLGGFTPPGTWGHSFTSLTECADRVLREALEELGRVPEYTRVTLSDGTIVADSLA